MAHFSARRLSLVLLLSLFGFALSQNTGEPLTGGEDRDLSGCSVEMQAHIFNLAGLTKVNKTRGDYQVSYKKGLGNVTIDFNICEKSFRQCPDGVSDYANIVNENHTCNHISAPTLSEVGVSLIDFNKPDLGLQLLFAGGSQCNETAKYSLLVQLNCDQYGKETVYELDTSSIKTPCSPKVIISSKEACAKVVLGTLWTFFTTYYFIFGAIMIVIGLFLVIVGGRYYKATMFLAGQFSVAAFIMIIMFTQVYPVSSPMWVVWLTLVVSVGIGSGAGYATQRWARTGVLLIGTWIGGIMGGGLYSAFLYQYADENPMMVLWMSIAFCAILVAVLSMVFFDHAVIFCSAILGSFVLVRGISVYTGGYPNEFLMAQQYSSGNGIPQTFFIYMAVMLLVSFLSVTCQLRARSKNRDLYNYRQYDFKYRRP